MTGGQSGFVVQESEAVNENRLVFASSIDKLLFGNIAGVRAFDARTDTLGKLIQLGCPTDLAVEGEFAYASVLGAPSGVSEARTFTISLIGWLAYR